MDSKVALLCIALIFILSMKGSKKQKGGVKKVVVFGVLALVGGLTIVIIVAIMNSGSKKTCAGAQCPSGKVMKKGVSDTVCSDQSDCTSKCCEESKVPENDPENDPDADILVCGKHKCAISSEANTLRDSCDDYDLKACDSGYREVEIVRSSTYGGEDSFCFLGTTFDHGMLRKCEKITQ